MRLRKLEKKDVPFMQEWMHDNDINKVFLKSFNDYQEKDIIDFINDSINKKNVNYACVDNNDEYLGTVSLKNIDIENKNAEYAICFRKKAHGTGAAKYATNTILNIAFDELKLEKVYLNVLRSNKRAYTFYRKYGFHEEGCFRKHIYKNNEYLDLIWLSMLKEEF